MRLHLLPFLLGLAASAAVAEPAAAFLRPGERLELRMSYGLLGTAGSTVIETEREEATGHFRITVTTRSSGIVDTLYPINNDSESILEAGTGRPLLLKTKGKNGRRLTEKTTTFDYATGQAAHINAIRPQHSATVPLPQEPAYDLMVALLQTRGWGLQVGESRRLSCVNDTDFFTLEVTAVAEERIRTPAGTFDTVVLEPKPVGEPAGFFRKGGALKLWISRGPQPQIVRLDTKTRIGTIVAVLARASTAADSAAAAPGPRAGATESAAD